MPFGEPPVRFPAWDAPQERQLLERTSGRGAGGTGFKAPRGVPNGNGPDRTAWVGWENPTSAIQRALDSLVGFF